MRPRIPAMVVAAGAALGLLFASVSTFDFVAHLDREVHTLHCSFVPGLTAAHSGASGCHATLMSPYSSFLRGVVWGGVPLSLAAMAVFAFLLFLTVDLIVTRRQDHPRWAATVALVTVVPALASITMASISLIALDAVCRVCVGIYVSSALCLGGGLWWRSTTLTGRGARGPSVGRLQQRLVARREPRAEDPAWLRDADDSEDPGAAEKEEGEPEEGEERAAAESQLQRELPRQPSLFVLVAKTAALLATFVAVPMVTYLVVAPDHSRYLGSCGSIATAEGQVPLVSLSSAEDGVPAIEVLDPLCPACRAFEGRLEASGMRADLHRQVLLFPLDDRCNWMVESAMHPGACTVSEAMLCAGDDASRVLRWAFEHQEEIRARAAQDPEAAAAMVREAFPALASCVGSPEVRARLNQGLRWAVANHLKVLTPQLFVAGDRLCDEDVDLGLEFALTRMVDAYRAGERPAGARAGTEVPETEAPRSEVPGAEAPGAEAPKTEPMADVPTSDEPKAEPTPEEPKAGEPKAGEPEAEEPKAGEPEAEEPKAGQPVTGGAAAAEKDTAPPAAPAGEAAPADGPKAEEATGDEPTASDEAPTQETP